MLDPARDILPEPRHGAEPTVVGLPAASPLARRLAGDVFLVVWDLPARLAASPRLVAADGRRLMPLASLKLATASGGTRVAWALRAPSEAARPGVRSIAAQDDGGALRLVASAGTVGPTAEVVLPEGLPAVGIEVLLDGLAPQARLPLASALLNAWPGLFRLAASPGYLRLLAALVRAMAPEPPGARPVASVDANTLLVEADLPRALASVGSVHLLRPDRLARLDAPPFVGDADREGRRPAHLAVPTAALGAGGLLVFSGPDGLAVRRIAPRGRLASLVGWWRARPRPDPGLRDYVTGRLTDGSPAARAAGLEIEIACPLPARRLTGGGDLPSAEIDLAVVCPDGLLAGGWFHDPRSLVAGVDLLGPDKAGRPLDAVWHRFEGRVGEGEEAVRATGFAAFLPGAGAAGRQPRFALRLASGGRRTLVPSPQPIDATEARSRVLRAIPPQHVTDAAIETCLAPALAGLQARLKAERGTPTVRRIGTPPTRPAASIVVPLYKVLDFLRVQVGAFAMDPVIADCAELIYVLDSPEQAEAVEHLLTGLEILYRVPITLVVMGRNAGYSAACNAGAAVARGGVLAMVNSDVIPIEPGWLGRLAGRLGEPGNIGAVGPKLLFEDGALQHAGLYFARDHRGRWLNHHYHKGFPGSFPAASIERPVPAVTGACLVVPRALYERVGGFTEDYVIGDYEDSDLCLKIRAEGHDIVYMPSVALHHLERRSIQHSADHARGVASLYNAWLHERRWGGVIEALMAGPAAATRSAA